MIISGKTDIGRVRQNNEDSILFKNEKIGFLPNLFIVADGMGGHSAGEIASNDAIKFFCEFIESNPCGEYLDTIINAAKHSNLEVLKKSNENVELSGMGTTFTASVIDEENEKLFLAHVGDSRLYIIRHSEITQITSDHTYVYEMVKAGQMSLEESRNHPKKNIITRAMGTSNNLLIDGVILPIMTNDKILICSDGLTNLLTDASILDIITTSQTVDAAVNNLVSCANENGGFDNISVILIEYVR